MKEVTVDLFDVEEAAGELTDSDIEVLDLLEALYRASNKIAIKKLAKNDRGWAWSPPSTKQAGIYVPKEFRDGLFFPKDDAILPRADKPAILDLSVPVRWPQAPAHGKEAHYKRFTEKNSGTETHLTQLPRSIFKTAGPASYLVMGRLPAAPPTSLVCVVVDSGSTVHAMLDAKFDLRPDFQAGVFDPPTATPTETHDADELQTFMDEAVEAVATGTLELMLRKYARMPAPALLSAQAQQIWLERNPESTLNPMKLSKPGDAVRELVAHIEFDLYRKHEVRTRAVNLIELVLGDRKELTVKSLVTSLVRDFSGFYSEMLNAAQQRKARVGAGFETHIRALLEAGAIPFAEQKVVSSLRPDFVLPSVALYQAKSPSALVLSAKTTLRERWKQVTMEKRGCPVFLATMDEKVAVSSVRKMREHDVFLVVPEAFKAKGKGTVVDFSAESNVLSFSEFFKEEIGVRRVPLWQAERTAS